MTNKIFLSIVIGFFAGVFVSSFFELNSAVAFFVAGLGLALIIFGYFNLSSRKIFLSAALFLIFVSVGILRFHIKDIQQEKQILDNFVGQEVEVLGTISAEVEQRQSTQRIIMDAESITLRGENYGITSKILVSTEFYPEFQYGEEIKVVGEIEKPENFITDIGREFDYINYLKKDSIFYTMSFAEVESIGDSKRNLKSGILSIKEKFLNSIEKVVPKPESALLSGLLLGVKESLGKDLEQAFIDTGLIHIIVLSGYNVTIIAEAVIKTLSFLSVTAGIYVGGIFIILFAIMTGGGATIIRASIMALLALIARATGRRYEITRALLLAAMVMILHNPYILVFDISFQLSFLATLGLIYMAPIFEKLFKFMPTFLGLREITAATFGVQVFVLPFILYKIGNLSVVAPITNLLVLPLIPATMFYGFLTGLFGLLSGILAAPFGFITFILLKFEIFIVELFAGFSFASLTVSRFPFVLVLICYALIFWWIRKYERKNREKVS